MWLYNLASGDSLQFIPSIASKIDGKCLFLDKDSVKIQFHHYIIRTFDLLVLKFSDSILIVILFRFNPTISSSLHSIKLIKSS